MLNLVKLKQQLFYVGILGFLEKVMIPALEYMALGAAENVRCENANCKVGNRVAMNLILAFIVIQIQIRDKKALTCKHNKSINPTVTANLCRNKTIVAKDYFGVQF